MAEISEETKAFVDGVAAEAIRVETPCGDGKMVWRIWGAGPPLVLFHGGYGSWTHWIRNVLPLSRSFTVIAPDLPGLGESATPPEPHTAEGLARILVDGIDLVLPQREPLHLAGFSFGGVLGGHVAAQLGDRVRAFTVVGSNGLGLIRQPTDLQRVPAGSSDRGGARGASSQSRRADDRRSGKDRRACGLYPIRLMRRAAGSGAGAFPAPTRLVRALPLVTARLDGIWGGRDATAYPHLDERANTLRSFQPEARFEIIEGAGHWVQYEAADRFNPLLAEIVRSHLQG